jgi:hypothetical protein
MEEEVGEVPDVAVLSARDLELALSCSPTDGDAEGAIAPRANGRDVSSAGRGGANADEDNKKARLLGTARKEEGTGLTGALPSDSSSDELLIITPAEISLKAPLASPCAIKTPPPGRDGSFLYSSPPSGCLLFTPPVGLSAGVSRGMGGPCVAS